MSVRIIDGGVILVSTGVYDNIYLKPGSITGFSGPSIIDAFEIYTGDNRVIKIRPKKEDMDDTKHTLGMVLTMIPSYAEMVKVVSDIRSQLEADLLYTNQRIDMLYDHTQKSLELDETLSECSTELESLEVVKDEVKKELKKEEDLDNPNTNHYLNHLFIILLAGIILQCIYMINKY
jgi:hypothetical protein